MTLYVAQWYDSDGFTYGCDHVLGVFDTRDKADECCLRYAESNKLDLANFETVERQLNEDWE